MQKISFLKKLCHDAMCQIFVIFDNARYHSKQVKSFLETQPGQIMIPFLPVY
jgi:hypothetical protein